ncbi:MAG: hypothetical protein V4568_01675 [Pseudomonadota bacterium]
MNQYTTTRIPFTATPAKNPSHSLGLDPELLLEWFQAPIAFHRPLVDLAGGSISAAVMLTHALHGTREFYFAGECHPNLALQGFMQMSQVDWERETGLTRSAQETARRILRKRGYLEEKRTGIPAKLYFRVNIEKLYADLKAQARNRLKEAHSKP